MANKKVRNMKVYNVSGYQYKDTPTIIMKGDWLKQLGFDIGSLIRVECEDGKLMITLREEEYIDALQKMPMSKVAEEQAGYHCGRGRK